MSRAAALVVLLALGAPHVAPTQWQAQAQSQAGRQDGGAVVGRSAKVYRALRSLRADFIQVIDNPTLGVDTTRGTLTQAGEAKFAMRFSDPAGDAIVIDGERIWVYTPSTTPGQVIRMPVPSGGPAYGYNILAWLLDRPTERYKTTWLRSEQTGRRMADVVELIPNVPDLPFDRAVLWLDREDGLPRRLEIHEVNTGLSRTLTLSNIHVDQRISDKTFKLDLPSNVRIVDQ